MVQTMDGPHLLVDGRNCAYRAIYANKDNRAHSLLVMIRFMRTWLTVHNPKAVHVFWDVPRETLWRKQIMAEYKDRESASELPGRDVRVELGETQDAARELFAAMNIRQYIRKEQEADDLIYAACRNVLHERAIIVSSDGDFAQIPYYFDTIQLWEPRLKKFIERPKYNPVVKKALMGDESDNIDGYNNIGPVKSTQMAECPKKLHQFLRSGVDRRIFLRNMLLTDLGLSQSLLANQMYVARQMQQPLVYDKNAIIKLSAKHKIRGLLQEFDKTILPFRDLVKSDTPQA